MRHAPLLALALLAPRAAGGGEPVAVAAAANLKPALAEIAAAFERAHPGAEVRVTYGASGAFHAQIRNGAPFDLFLSADAALPARLAADGLAGEPFAYAVGRLALWVPRASPLALERDGLLALLDPRVLKVAIANPAAAPYGVAAEEALRSAGALERVRPKLVLGQNVAQAAQFAQSGNAQAALLPLSLVVGPPLSEEGRHVLAPAALHAPIVQAGAIPRAARAPGLARALADFLLGPEGAAILRRHGYEPPPP